MFIWKLKKLFKNEIESFHVETSNKIGVNKRAINLLPNTLDRQYHEIAPTKNVRIHHLLISIEGNQRTCCLKIHSLTNKTRSALLIFRGRVLGCIYGKRNFGHQVMTKQAYQKFLSELAKPGGILDAYQLPEDLTLACASLFCGQVLNLNQKQTMVGKYELAVNQIMESGMPGCVVVKNGSGETLCIVYLANNQVLGVYSGETGWIESSFNANIDSLKHAVAIDASILPIEDEEGLNQMGFSLTGLSDNNVDTWKMYNAQEHLNSDFGQVRMSFDNQNNTLVKQSNSSYIRRLYRPSRVRHAHVINP